GVRSGWNLYHEPGDLLSYQGDVLLGERDAIGSPVLRRPPARLVEEGQRRCVAPLLLAAHGEVEQHSAPPLEREALRELLAGLVRTALVHQRLPLEKG